MIIGGKNSQDLSSVELFNWRTGEQCPLKDIPIRVRIHAGTVFEGVPIICGGFSSEESIANCYKYSIQDKSWSPVSTFFSMAPAWDTVLTILDFICNSMLITHTVTNTECYSCYEPSSLLQFF